MGCASTEVIIPIKNSPTPPLHEKKQRKKTKNQANKKERKRKGVEELSGAWQPVLSRQKVWRCYVKL